jgi:hypothetical protein
VSTLVIVVITYYFLIWNFGKLFQDHCRKKAEADAKKAEAEAKKAETKAKKVLEKALRPKSLGIRKSSQIN